MNEEVYNRICLPYQFLTKRFDFNQSYVYDELYKCYNPKTYGVREERLEALKKFENLSFRDLFTEDQLKVNFYSENYLECNLVKIEENRICTHMELGQVFLYLLITKLEKGISSFLLLLNKLIETNKGLIHRKDEKIIMDISVFDDLSEQFERISDYKYIFHLFAKTNLACFTKDWNNNIVINIHLIEKLLNTRKIFDFTNVEL